MDNVFLALAHPVRREVLQRLRKGPMSAGDLAAAFDVSKPTMSRHFSQLKDAGLVTQERRGTSIRYRLNMSVAEEVLTLVMAALDAVQAGKAGGGKRVAAPFMTKPGEGKSR